MSMGLIHPSHKSSIPEFPAEKNINNYWDLALDSSRQSKNQHILHNVGLKAIVYGLLVSVMTHPKPESPQEVAAKLQHMRGIPWFEGTLRAKKDDWVKSIGTALGEMYNGSGTRRGIFNMTVKKTVENGQPEILVLR